MGSRRIFLVLVGVCLFGLNGPEKALANTQAMGWNKVWSDEFDYEGHPDSKKWGYDVGGGGWGLNEDQFHTDNRLENARVEKGNLIIEARKENYSGKKYTSARLVSRGKCERMQGRFEARLITPGFKGIFPAFWMIPSNESGGWPAFGELDIMEQFGFDPGIIRQTLHCSAHAVPNPIQVSTPLADCREKYHVYRMDWTKDSISFYIDDTLTKSYKETQDYAHWPFTKPFYMILQVPVGGSFAGQQGIIDSLFPSQMLVDYVRVYEWGVVEAKPNPLAASLSPMPDIRIALDRNAMTVFTPGRFSATLVDVAGRCRARQTGADQCRFTKRGLGRGMYYLTVRNARGSFTKAVINP
jgi:beta-glucanase (GH16 family)